MTSPIVNQSQTQFLPLQRSSSKLSKRKEPELTHIKKFFFKVMDGNANFSKRYIRNNDEKARAALASKQNPIVSVIRCSDSRCSNIILNQIELGKVFDIASAGTQPSDEGIESLAYSVNHLGVTLVLVIGHKNCGAVKAVLDGHGNEIPHIAARIQKAVSENCKDVNDAVVMNTSSIVEKLKNHDLFKSKIAEKKLVIVGAVQSLKTAKLKIINPADLEIFKLDNDQLKSLGIKKN